ncbi:hypothetical protein ACFRAA_31410 [[Kitasatospora] papulosa]|uniref:hypothetical protein n=1 Tax=Streptomyces TaxID=1883 RepID=UPI0023B05676|nr:hypothetical protein [Streptomyces sp. KA12]MDF0376130.1 hypothetical protein [Streptomyces sp. KA12]
MQHHGLSFEDASAELRGLAQRGRGADRARPETEVGAVDDLLSAQPGDVAERAATHPHAGNALLLAAHLLSHRGTDPCHDFEVRAQARALLLAMRALPGAERPDALERLRRRWYRPARST